LRHPGSWAEAENAADDAAAIASATAVRVRFMILQLLRGDELSG
jgi:hypothetical protein